ncbi:MAG: L-ribulose-5-phosphate 4-epimerase AraD [Eubacteriales bacterium]
MLEQLKAQVCAANKSLADYGLVLFTWGNVSGIDRDSGLVVIKPSGVEYSALTPEDMTVVDLDGKKVEGLLNPSSDTPTHVELYKAFPEIGGITHTHSLWATSFAQAGRSIRPYGTTHADYFAGEVPCTRQMTRDEIEQDYESNTGKVIIETYKKVDYREVPAVLVSSHAPFVWGKDAHDSVHNSVVLENIAQMAYNTEMLGLDAPGVEHKVSTMSKTLHHKHYYRKHGAGAYYGQGGDNK